MSNIKIGDKVKMSEYLKDGLNKNGCEQHVKEFGDCEGYVEGVFPNGEGPELDVRWEPSGLRYGYDPERDLVKVVDMNKSREEILAKHAKCSVDEINDSERVLIGQDEILPAMEEFANQEAERRERLAYRKGLREMAEHKDKEIKALEAKLNGIEIEIDQRIAHLISVDAEFCKDRWDDSKPQMERNIYREMSNQVTATRQELQMLKKNLGMKENTVAPDMSVRDIAAESYKTDMAAFAEGCGKPFNTLAWHVFKRAFDIASFRLKLPKKGEAEEILALMKKNVPVPIEARPQTTEYIMCSAVNWRGTIICGRRHKDCYKVADALMNGGFLERERKHQGFMTSTGRFVTREEAFLIAKDNKQIIHKMFDNDATGSLTSEDLFGTEE